MKQGIERIIRQISRESFMIKLCSGQRFYVGSSEHIEVVQDYASTGRMEDLAIMRLFHDHLERARNARQGKPYVHGTQVLFVQVDDDVDRIFSESIKASGASRRLEMSVGH